MRILIVEDDAALGVFLQRGLQLLGHDVHLAGDGVSGQSLALELGPDLMILDLGLPQKDGLAVLEGMQGNVRMTSVLVLTGRSGIEHRVRALNLGADDCMLKPFSFTELTARIQALVRRREQFADASLRFAGIELNRLSRTVNCDGQPVELTAKEFALLERLLSARGRCCTRTELLRDVWRLSPDAGTNVVDVYINYLRKKLGAARQAALGLQSGVPHGAGRPDRVIETVRGEGYALAASAATGARRPFPRTPDALHLAPGLPAGFGREVYGAARQAHA